MLHADLPQQVYGFGNSLGKGVNGRLFYRLRLPANGQVQMRLFVLGGYSSRSRAEDALAQEVLEQVYAYLGAAIANICNTVDPDAVVIGGGVSKAGQLLLDGIERHFKRHVFHAVAPVEFRLAQLGNDAGAYGAYKLILQ